MLIPWICKSRLFFAQKLRRKRKVWPIPIYLDRTWLFLLPLCDSNQAAPRSLFFITTFVHLLNECIIKSLITKESSLRIGTKIKQHYGIGTKPPNNTIALNTKNIRSYLVSHLCWLAIRLSTVVKKWSLEMTFKSQWITGTSDKSDLFPFNLPLRKHLTSPLFNVRAADAFGTNQDLLFLAYNELRCNARFRASAASKHFRSTANERNVWQTGSSPD